MPDKKNILIISPEPWSHIFVSKHHYAIELSKRGHEVFFLNPPDHSHYKNITLRALNDHPGITIIDYRGQLKGLRFLPVFLRLFQNRKFLHELENLAGCRFDAVWNFENSRFFDMQFAGDRIKIYHQVDLNQTFNLKQAAASSDICFCTTDLIKNQILPYNKKVYKIHHGASNEALQYKYSVKERNEFPLQAVYIGNLDMAFIDRELMKNLIFSFPEVKFLLVGPYDKNGEMFQALNQFSNVEWLGKKPSEDIPSYLEKADILMVLYAEKYHKDQASPHKFMEYFASGRIIVATYTDEYKDKRNLLAMSDRQEDYLSLFRDVVNNIEWYNHVDRQQERKAFALENSYEKQVDKISNYCRQNNVHLFNFNEHSFIHQ